MTSFYFACAHDNRHVLMPRQNIQRQFVFGVFCPSRALMGASPSRISLSKIAFRDPKFEFFARRRPTMVGGAGGAFGALPNLQFPPLYTNFFSSRAPRATISAISKTAVKCLHFTAHIVCHGRACCTAAATRTRGNRRARGPDRRRSCH